MADSTLSTGELISLFSAISAVLVALFVFMGGLVVRSISGLNKNMQDNAKEAKQGRADLHEKIDSGLDSINKDINGLGARVLELEVEKRVMERMKEKG